MRDSGRRQRSTSPWRRGFGEAVRRARTAKGWKRATLADRCEGLSADYLAKIEQGGRVPREPLMAEIADALDLALDDLLARAEALVHDQLADEHDPVEDTPGEEEDDVAAQRAAPRRGPAGRRPADPTFSADPRIAAVAAQLAALPEHLRPRTVGAVTRLLARYLDTDAPPRHLDRLLDAVTDHDVDPDVLDRAVEIAVTSARAAADELDDEQLRRMLDHARALARTDAEPVHHGQERVASIPAGEVRYVWAKAVARDQHGQLWVDPTATAHRAGFDHADPRVRRLDDGRVLVDLTRLDDPDAVGPPQPQRHRQRAVTAPGALDPHAPPRQAYQSARLEITWSDDAVIVVDAAAYDPDAATRAVDHGYPAGIDNIHVLTAANPHPRVLPPEENQRRNQQLRAELNARRWRFTPCTTASADPHDPWREPSFAVIDGDRDTIADLARDFGQAVIFEWTPTHRGVIRLATADTPEDEELSTHGWHAQWLPPQALDSDHHTTEPA